MVKFVLDQLVRLAAHELIEDGAAPHTPLRRALFVEDGRDRLAHDSRVSRPPMPRPAELWL